MKLAKGRIGPMGMSLILYIRCVGITNPFITDPKTMKKRYIIRRSVARIRIANLRFVDWVDLFSDSILHGP